MEPVSKCIKKRTAACEPDQPLTQSMPMTMLCFLYLFLGTRWHFYQRVWTQGRLLAQEGISIRDPMFHTNHGMLAIPSDVWPYVAKQTPEKCYWCESIKDSMQLDAAGHGIIPDTLKHFYFWSGFLDFFAVGQNAIPPPQFIYYASDWDEITKSESRWCNGRLRVKHGRNPRVQDFFPTSSETMPAEDDTFKKRNSILFLGIIYTLTRSFDCLQHPPSTTHV